MQISGLVKLKCYVILEGLENSLGENLTCNFDILDADFFSGDEQQKAIKRIREDIGD
jgi:hypothetical protein